MCERQEKGMVQYKSQNVFKSGNILNFHVSFPVLHHTSLSSFG